jgi:hypothetical protein
MGVPMGCDLVPIPVLCEAKEGVFELGPGMSVQASAGLEKEAALLAEWLSGIEGVGQVGISRAHVANAATSISLSLDPGMQQSEEYELGITPQGIRIAAKDATGIVRGAASLYQLALSQGRALRSLVDSGLGRVLHGVDSCSTVRAISSGWNL